MEGERKAVDSLAALRDAVRRFLDDEELDRVAFARLVRMLRDLELEQRKVVYDYLLRETVNASSPTGSVRSQALARIADLVGQEPPEIGSDYRPGRMKDG